jgi:hypothetical protein
MGEGLSGSFNERINNERELFLRIIYFILLLWMIYFILEKSFLPLYAKLPSFKICIFLVE